MLNGMLLKLLKWDRLLVYDKIINEFSNFVYKLS